MYVALTINCSEESWHQRDDDGKLLTCCFHSLFHSGNAVGVLLVLKRHYRDAFEKYGKVKDWLTLQFKIKQKVSHQNNLTGLV